MYPRRNIHFPGLRKAGFALLALLLPVVAQAAPEVSNLTASQRPGTKLVDIRYDLAGGGYSTVAVRLQVSSNGGTTWTVPATTLSGAIGNNVTPGTGRVIVWNAGADWPGGYSTQMRFRVIADDQVVPLEGFSFIPAGSFIMGRTSGDTDADAPPITVTVSGFYIQQTETTRARWHEVRSWGFNNGYTDIQQGQGLGIGMTDHHPIVGVSWWDVVKWCNARSEKEGLTPVYRVEGNVMRTGRVQPTADWSANGYRLPTEAEWEKAARGGVAGQRFPWGDSISHTQANFYNDGSETYANGTKGFHPIYTTRFQPYTSPVASFAANGFGLYDLAGNVTEWCWDWYDPNYFATSNGSVDPRGPLSGDEKALRGGDYNVYANESRIAYRRKDHPGGGSWIAGFRPVRSAVP